MPTKVTARCTLTLFSSGVSTEQPLRPRREEVDYLVRRVKEQISRNQEVLTTEAIQEYQRALKAYEALRQTARE